MFDTKLQIVTVPNPILKQVATKIDYFAYDYLTQLSHDMIEIIKDVGVGLAAPQVGVSSRLIVITVQGFEPLVMCNPEIKWSKGRQFASEGCLSIPGVHVDIYRAFKVKVDYQTTSGCQTSITANQYLARVIQHEVDHLNGVLITDYVYDKTRRI